jgi:hypothetical protein
VNFQVQVEGCSDEGTVKKGRGELHFTFTFTSSDELKRSRVVVADTCGDFYTLVNLFKDQTYL